MTHRAIAAGATRVPGLRRLPVFRLLALGEIALLARTHLLMLEPAERSRLVELIRRGRGRSARLSAHERDELGDLLAKAQPRLFVGLAADKLSPVRLPRRVVRGKRPH